MTDKEFIKLFHKITVRNVCQQVNSNYFNIISGTAGYSSTKKVVDEIVKQLNELLEKRNSISIEPIDTRTLQDLK